MTQPTERLLSRKSAFETWQLYRSSTDDMTIACKILQHVCKRCDVTMSELEGPRRHPRFVWPRFLTVYLIRQHTTMTTHCIGALLNRDHVSIIWAYAQAKNEMLYPKSKRQVEEIEQELGFTKPADAALKRQKL